MSWWTIDHAKSDPARHIYCGTCRPKIPPFLVRDALEFLPSQQASGDDSMGSLTCEGCGKNWAQCDARADLVWHGRTMFCDLEAGHRISHQITITWDGRRDLDLPEPEATE